MPYNGTQAVSASSNATSSKTEDTAAAKKSTSNNKANTSKSTSQAVKTHVMQSGETISHLAVKYNTTTKKILELNPGINPNKVRIGQKIRVQPGGGSKQSAPKQQPLYHTMQSGETISHLAVKYGTTTKKIQALNPSLNPAKPRIGQKVRVK
jgi:LysM repeat protein